MAKYRPDRPVNLSARLNKGDEEYVADLQNAVQYYGDEYNKLLDQKHLDNGARLRLQRELDIHRKYLAIMGNMKGINNR